MNKMYVYTFFSVRNQFDIIKQLHNYINDLWCNCEACIMAGNNRETVAIKKRGDTILDSELNYEKGAIDFVKDEIIKKSIDEDFGQNDVQFDGYILFTYSKIRNLRLECTINESNIINQFEMKEMVPYSAIAYIDSIIHRV